MFFYFCLFSVFSGLKEPAILLQGLVIGYCFASSGNSIGFSVLTSRTFFMKLAVFFQIYKIYCHYQSFPRPRSQEVSYSV